MNRKMPDDLQLNFRVSVNFANGKMTNPQSGETEDLLTAKFRFRCDEWQWPDDADDSILTELLPVKEKTAEYFDNALSYLNSNLAILIKCQVERLCSSLDLRYNCAESRKPFSFLACLITAFDEFAISHAVY